MARLGLFPLPLVLVPTERVPLHIFEPRYRELIGECIDTGAEFGVLLKKPGGEAHAVGTRAAVVEVLRRLPDGRMHIAVEGRERFRVLEVHDDRSFLEGTTEPVADKDDPPAAGDVAKALDLFARLQHTVGLKPEPPLAGSPLLDFEIVSRVDFGNDEKQELIELASPHDRFERLVELLERALEALTLERAVMRSASANGKVTPLSGE
jgi:ATP-dependent Lon protease